VPVFAYYELARGGKQPSGIDGWKRSMQNSTTASGISLASASRGSQHKAIVSLCKGGLDRATPIKSGDAFVVAAKRLRRIDAADELDFPPHLLFCFCA